MIVKEYHGQTVAYDIRQAMGKPFDDLKYITNAWLNAYRSSPEMNMPGRVDKDYYHYTHKKLNQIIPRASKAGSCYMCHVADAPMQFRGFMVAEAFENFPPVIHWLQVKKLDKRQGVATALIEQFFFDFKLNPDCIIYTFSSQDMKRRKEIVNKFEERGIRLLYLPDMKTTLNDPDWEV
jgi:hypothetical protein